MDSFFQKLKKKIDRRINKLLKEGFASHEEVLTHQIKTGGKRLRPILSILVCQNLGGSFKDVVYPACGLEILHNYLLIIDDIIDKSEIRRGEPTTWKKFGHSMAECAGVGYSASLMKAANKSQHPQRILNLYSQTLKKITTGEINDILFETQTRAEEPYIQTTRPDTISKKDYLQMIKDKTASLFKASFAVGAVCAESNKEAQKKVKKAGLNLGIAFQIQDDILDIFGQKQEFGKEIGKDIQERKRGNIVILFASKEDKQIIPLISKSRQAGGKKTKEIIAKIQDTNALQKAKQLKEKFDQKAQEKVSLLPDNAYKQRLMNIIKQLKQRKK